MKPPLRIGLTGNIGSGKSTVSHIFSTLGIPVYHADDESKKLLADPDVASEIVHRFGPGILAGGSVDRKALAAIVFSDSASLRALNAILHPRVKQDFREWITRHGGNPYVVQEAAILFESGFREEYHFVINVSCPKETAIDRVVKRDGVDGRLVLQRMQHQMDDAEKSRLADFVITNDGTRAVLPQVLALHEHLLQVCAQGDDDVAPGGTDA
ncbi:MAG TPA: dephospho-CoA kinase [Bacteroidales bacterium]|nr:dephospho-CoA kinase [Bacteroidales bacterium]HPS62473.1 dephospho-CoA kinase [Bacteroidales bacterium]